MRIRLDKQEDGTNSKAQTALLVFFFCFSVPEWHLGMFQKSHIGFSSPSDWWWHNYSNKVGKYTQANGNALNQSFI